MLYTCLNLAYSSSLKAAAGIPKQHEHIYADKKVVGNKNIYDELNNSLVTKLIPEMCKIFQSPMNVKKI